MSVGLSDIDEVPVFDSTGTPNGLGSLLGGVGSIFGPAGVMGAGGMPPVDLSSYAESKAISGGTFASGDVVFGKSETLIYAAVVVLGLLIIFGRKK